MTPRGEHRSGLLRIIAENFRAIADELDLQADSGEPVDEGRIEALLAELESKLGEVTPIPPTTKQPRGNQS